MRIQATFSVNGAPVHLDTETGLTPMPQRWRFSLLKLKGRMDKNGCVHPMAILNGDRMPKPELLEATEPTLSGLLDSVQRDEELLRGPVIRTSHVRTVRTTGKDGLPHYTSFTLYQLANKF